MFAQLRVSYVLVSVLAVLLLLVANAGSPGVSADQSTAPSPAAVSPTAIKSCSLFTPFDATKFPSSPLIDNPWFPLKPGMRFVWDGRENVGGQPVDHQVILIVTDLTKKVHGVTSVVLWDRDFRTGVLRESELTFHAQDSAKNIWNLGEYPATYSGGKFLEAADTWISGLNGAQGGTVIPGDPKTGTPIFLQAFAPNIIYDCGQVASIGQQTPPLCVPVGCYSNVLTIDENSVGEAGTQQKYYATGGGNFKVGASTTDPQGEELVLLEAGLMSSADCVAARNAALALEDQAYNHDTTQTVYKQTEPMKETKLCDSLQPTVTPTATVGTPGPAPKSGFYMPIIAKLRPAPTATPIVPPGIFDGCRDDPNPAGATNFPVRIVKVNKLTEVVTLQNVSNATVSVEDWNMCSINGNQEHDQIFGTLAAGQIRDFPNQGGGSIWDDNARDDGALYNAAGFLVSYWVDQ